MTGLSPFNDWQDFGSPPVVGSTIVEDETENATPNTIFRIDTSALTDCILLISHNDFAGGAAFYELRSGYLAPDSFTTIGRSGFVLADEQTALVPFSNLAPQAELYLEAFTDGPVFTTYKVITRDGAIERTAITGYSPSIIESRVIADSGFELFEMSPLIAARHQLHVQTDSPDYVVQLVCAIDEDDQLRIDIASNTNPTGAGIEITTPVGFWRIRVQNNDAVAEDFRVMLVTKP